MFIIGFLLFIFAISGLKLATYVPAIAPSSEKGPSKPMGEYYFKETDIVNFNVLGQADLSVPYSVLISVEYSKLKSKFYQKPVLLNAKGEVFIARPVKSFIKMIEYLLDNMQPQNFENSYERAEFLSELNYWNIPSVPQTKVQTSLIYIFDQAPEDLPIIQKW